MRLHVAGGLSESESSSGFRVRVCKAASRIVKCLVNETLPAATRDAWRADIARAFTDVARGDVLCGVYLPDQGARFYTNGRLTADIPDPVFARAFFDIWLDPRTRAQSLRRQLLGDTAR